MKSLRVMVALSLVFCAPDAHAGCRKRVKFVEKVVVQKAVPVIQNNYFAPPQLYAAVYGAPPQVAFNAHVSHVYQQQAQYQQAAVSAACCIPCCVSSSHGVPRSGAPGTDASQPETPSPAGLNEQARAIFAEHCYSCHGNTQQKAGLNLEALSWVKNGEQRTLLEIVSASALQVQLGKMPKNNPAALTDQQAQALMELAVELAK